MEKTPPFIGYGVVVGNPVDINLWQSLWPPILGAWRYA
jgi:hypothetical protein